MAKARAYGEGTIRERKIRGRTYWEGRYYENGKRKSVYAGTQRDVVAKMREQQHDPDDGPAVNLKLSASRFLEDWLAEKAATAGKPGGLALNTYRFYETYVNRHLVPGLRGIKLATLQPAHVRQLMREKIAAGHTPHLANQCRVVLRVALNEALSDGLVKTNAAALTKPLTWEEPEINPLPVDEVRQLPELLRAFVERPMSSRGRPPSAALEPIVLIAATMGLRQQEILGLQRDHLDLENGIIRVRAALIRYKGNFYLKGLKSPRHRRDLRMPQLVIEAIERWLAKQTEQQAKLGPLWLNEWNLVFTNDAGEPLHPSNVTRAFQVLLSQSGLPKKRFYDLRHGTGTYMILQGQDLRTVQAQLGHTNIQTTTRYTHPQLLKEIQERVAGDMQAFMRGGSK